MDRKDIGVLTEDELVKRILETLDKEGRIADLLAFANHNQEVYQNKVMPAITSLVAKEMIVTTVHSLDGHALTPEGQAFIDHGSVEAQLFHLIPAQGIEKSTLMDILKAALAKQVSKVDEKAADSGFNNAMRAKWIRFDKRVEPKPAEGAEKKKEKAEVAGTVHKQVTEIVDQTQVDLKKVKSVLATNFAAKDKDFGVSDFVGLKKRGLVAAAKNKTIEVTKGSNFSTTVQEQLADLNADAIASGDWTKKPFKKLTLDAPGTYEGGHLHPLMKVRTTMRDILLEMGFSEMPTDKWVESSFWNFDALFQPQQHPARDAHDTFFLDEPKLARELAPEAEYVAKVKATHEHGGNDSIGWRYEWKETEARKNILRTHTTATSAQMLYKLSQECMKTGEFKPVKWFSIDRVFRNEKMDATHLCEFHQIEGVVCDKGLTLGDLMGTLSEFYKAIGITQLRFKPAFNPYTEPSMEIFGMHPTLGEKEVGNSGIFRPEMLRPMGFPADVQVIAWGLSLERPTMILYQIDKIRELFGPGVSLHKIETNPLCRLDKPHVKHA